MAATATPTEATDKPKAASLKMELIGGKPIYSMPTRDRDSFAKVRSRAKEYESVIDLQNEACALCEAIDALLAKIK